MPIPPHIPMIDIHRLLRRTRGGGSQEGFYSVIAKRIRSSYRKAGRLYQRMLRGKMPVVGHVKRSGVPTGEKIRLGDKQLPSAFVPYQTEIPGYEEGLIDGLHRHVRSGDRVVVVGGGVGVTSVIAAKEVGNGGSVSVYEASTEMTSLIRRTLELNGVRDRVDVHHAVVAESTSVRGNNAEEVPTHVAPEDLPECEVMELDCEGAEIPILTGMQVQPRSILVESHGIFGAPTAQVKEILGERGYSIHRIQIAESRLCKTCLENDIMVVSASR